MGDKKHKDCRQVCFSNNSLEVKARKGKFIVLLKTPVYFELDADKLADKDVFMVWLNQMYQASGRKIITLKETAIAFGYKTRQDVDNRAQRYRRWGNSILGVAAPYLDRPWVLTGRMCKAISRIWSENIFLKREEVQQELIRQGYIKSKKDISTKSIETWANYSGFVNVRKKLQKQLRNNQLNWSYEWLITQVLKLSVQMQNILESKKLLPSGIKFKLSAIKQKIDVEDSQQAGCSTSGLNTDKIRGFFLGKDFASDQQAGELQEQKGVGEDKLVCTGCGSDHTWQKTKIHEEVHFGFFHRTVEKIKGYCLNPGCLVKTFTHSKETVEFLLENMAVVTLLYTLLRGSFGRIGIFIGVSKSHVYRIFSAFGQAMGSSMVILFPPGKLVVCIDEKYVKIPKHFRGKSIKGKFCYFYVAVDHRSWTILHTMVSETKDQLAAELFMLGLRFKGYYPKVIVTDNEPALSAAIAKVFEKAIHHLCIFHQIKNMRDKLKDFFGSDFKKIPGLEKFVKAFEKIFDCKDKRTCKKRYRLFMANKEEYLKISEQLLTIFESLQRDFPKLVNAIGSKIIIPKTNNSAEEVIRIFNQHYKTMCGFESIPTAEIQVQAFAVVHNFTPLTRDAKKGLRGKCPLEIAGVNISDVPLYQMLKGPLAQRVRKLVVEKNDIPEEIAA